MDTCGDPCPCRACMTEWRLILFRIWDRNSKPNFACPGGRWNYDASYRWWYRPIAQRQLIWRKRCGMWTPMSYDLGRSEKERSLRIVRCVFVDDFYPFLSIWIGQIVDGLWVPLFTDTEQCHWQESIFSHDDEVYEETSSGLDHTNLTISHGDKSKREIREGKLEILGQFLPIDFELQSSDVNFTSATRGILWCKDIQFQFGWYLQATRARSMKMSSEDCRLICFCIFIYFLNVSPR